MTNDNPTPSDNDDKKTFDMYHFFSRKDILAAAVVIILLLLWTIYHAMTTGKII